MDKSNHSIILVGHGGVPTDVPNELVSKLKRLESQRRKLNLPPTKEELEIDRKIRVWPRTEQTDPYKFGLETLADHLKKHLKNIPVVTAYNEFCAPSMLEAADDLIGQGTKMITIISSMLTPGGSHSEIEIPEEIAILKERAPNVSINYAWPFNLDNVAKLFEEQIRYFSHS